MVQDLKPSLASVGLGDSSQAAFAVRIRQLWTGKDPKLTKIGWLKGLEAQINQKTNPSVQIKQNISAGLGFTVQGLKPSLASVGLADNSFVDIDTKSQTSALTVNTNTGSQHPY